MGSRQGDIVQGDGVVRAEAKRIDRLQAEANARAATRERAASASAASNRARAASMRVGKLATGDDHLGEIDAQNVRSILAF